MTGYGKTWKNDSFCVAKAIVSGCKSYRFSSWKLSLYTVKAMLSQKSGCKMPFWGVLLLFFMPYFLLDYVFYPTWFKSRDDKNVLFHALGKSIRTDADMSKRKMLRKKTFRDILVWYWSKKNGVRRRKTAN